MGPRQRAIGIDIGGTKTAVAAVADRGEILRELTLPTEPLGSFPSAVARIASAVSRVLAEVGWRADAIAGIGVGCAGPVDPVGGTIDNPYTLPGPAGGNVVAALRQQLGCPVVLENDADMALLGECLAGVGQGCDPVVMLTFGTGVGGAAWVGGRLLRGAAGGHPELGHVAVLPGGPSCYCGSSGCLESLASGTALAAAARAIGREDARELLLLADAGDVLARDARARALDAVAAATRTILHALLPERIILGGGMMDEHYELFARAAGEAVAQATLLGPARVSVAKARLGNRAGLVGAASAVWSRRLRRALR
jgi:glucokinase